MTDLIETSPSPEVGMVEPLDLDALEKVAREAISWAEDPRSPTSAFRITQQANAVLRLIATNREMARERDALQEQVTDWQDRAKAADEGLRNYENRDLTAAALLEQEGLLMAAEARAEAAEASNRELLEALTPLRRHLPLLDAAATPTKSEVFAICGHDAREMHAAISHALSKSEGSRDE